MRVVVAEDSVLLREGVVRLLEENDFEVVGQAGDAENLIRKVAAHRPDVAVVDIQMPPGQGDDGLRAALELRERLPGTGILVLSQYYEEQYALDLVAAGLGISLVPGHSTDSRADILTRPINDLRLERIVGLAYHKDRPLPAELLTSIGDAKEIMEAA